jgi:hypothetical protein
VRPRPGAHDHVLWITALALALVFLAVDTNSRLQTLRAIYPLRITDVPRPQSDPTSSTGYERGQHRLILPGLGTDGYHWIMHTERMLAGEGLRIRHSATDGPPHGREVHWSGSVRWWLAIVATAYRSAHPELQPAQALERVASWANTLALAVFLIVFTAVLAACLGAVPAALFALGNVTVYPLYQYSVAGFLDHHNLAAIAAFATVVLLVAGGAGWVRTPDDRTPPERHHDSAAWLPTRVRARRRFVAAGVAGGAGLWISAVTLAPVLIGIGLGALAARSLRARTPVREVAAQPAPELWRVWGIAGALTSVVFYLLEYFPSDFGLRLEVNHPLYALAWLAAADLLCRTGELAASDPATTDEAEFPHPLPDTAAGSSSTWLRSVFFRQRSSWVAERYSALWIHSFGRCTTTTSSNSRALLPSSHHCITGSCSRA